MDSLQATSLPPTSRALDFVKIFKTLDQLISLRIQQIPKCRKGKHLEKRT